MTGRELMVYILENNLEEKDVFEILFNSNAALNIYKAAEKFNVGAATINAWVQAGYLKGYVYKGQLRIPADAKPNIPE